MAHRHRPSNPRCKLPSPNRRLCLLLCLSVAFVALGSLHVFSSVLRRANDLGRRCSSPRGAAAGGGGAARPKVAIVTLSEDGSSGGGGRSFEGLMDVVRGNKEAYAEEMGYDFVDAGGLIDRKRPASWSKIAAVKSLLPDYDWVFWNDADTLVMNSTISLEEILEAATGIVDFHKSPDLIITEDFTGVNAGVFFVKKSKWSMEFLNTWWNQTDFIRFGSAKSGDNDALKHLLKSMPPEELRDHVRIAEMQCLFNSYPWFLKWKTAFRLLSSPTTIWKGAYSDGDFMVHLAGLNDKKGWATRILQESKGSEESFREGNAFHRFSRRQKTG